MARKKKNSKSELGQPEGTQASDTEGSKDTEIQHSVVEPSEESTDIVDEIMENAPKLTKELVNPLPKISLSQAIVRHLDDPRYRESWNAGILKHAVSFGLVADNTAEEWLDLFISYGLKTKS